MFAALFGPTRATFNDVIQVKKFSKNEPAAKVQVSKLEKVAARGHDMTMESHAGGTKKRLRKSPAVRTRQ